MKKYNGKIFITKLLSLSVGLLFMAIAMVLLAAAKLGSTPIQSITYVIYVRYGNVLSFGTLCFLWNMILLLIQIIILRRKFRLLDLAQIPLSLFFATAIDVVESVLSFLNPQIFLARIGLVFLGVLFLAAGIFLAVKADLVMNSGEAAVRAISIVTKKNFGTIKVWFDIIIVSSAILVSILLFGKWRFDIVGIATLVCSLFTGTLVQAITYLTERLGKS